MKPLGISADFRVVQSSRVEDAIWDAAIVAHSHGWTVRRFDDEASAAWNHLLRRAARERADREADNETIT